MKTLSIEEARMLRAIIADMDNTAKHEALCAIISHMRDFHVLNQVRLREIIDLAKKYNGILKSK